MRGVAPLSRQGDTDRPRLTPRLPPRMAESRGMRARRRARHQLRLNSRKEAWGFVCAPSCAGEQRSGAPTILSVHKLMVQRSTIMDAGAQQARQEERATAAAAALGDDRTPGFSSRFRTYCRTITSCSRRILAERVQRAGAGARHAVVVSDQSMPNRGRRFLGRLSSWSDATRCWSPATPTYRP